MYVCLLLAWFCLTVVTYCWQKYYGSLLREARTVSVYVFLSLAWIFYSDGVLLIGKLRSSSLRSQYHLCVCVPLLAWFFYSSGVLLIGKLRSSSQRSQNRLCVCVPFTGLDFLQWWGTADREIKVLFTEKPVPSLCMCSFYWPGFSTVVGYCW